MKLYVLGASGGVGKQLVEQALKRGHEVTAHVRGSSRLSVPERVQVVRREVSTTGAFEKLPGHDAVITCVGNRRVGPSPWAKLRSSPRVCESMAHSVVSAMRECEIKRVVAVSAAGVGDSAAGVNLAMRFLLLTSKIGVAYKDLDAMEQVFAASGLDWFCVRPVLLVDGRATGNVAKVDRFSGSAKITRADVATFMLDRVEERWPFIAHTQQIAGA